MTESVQLDHAAIDAGINFLDNAWEYHEAKAKSGWVARSKIAATRSS